MQVANQHTQQAMWDKNRLQPYFVRSVSREKHPVGRVYKDQGGDYRAEVQEVFVVQLANPKTGNERAIVIDPRHPQSRDHLKLAQDVLEGRVGGLTPVRLQFEKAEALDPNGNPVPGSKLLRVAEMENPAPTRNEAKVFVGGQHIGEWTTEVDSAVDHAVSFEVASQFSTYMQTLATDPDATEWKEIESAARKKLDEALMAQIPDPAQRQQEVARFMPTRDDFLAGRHVDPSGTQAAATVWDPKRSAVPQGNAEMAAFFTQRVLIERFQHNMLHVVHLDEEGKPYETNVITDTEGKLIEEQHIPAGKPKRNSEIDEMIVAEKARAIGTHMFAGYLKMQGADVKHPDLAAELKDNWRMHADVEKTLDALQVPAPMRAKHYFAVAATRAAMYRKDAAQRVEIEARKSMKFPESEVEKEKEDNRVKELLQGVTVLGQHASSAGKEIEGVSFGL